MEMRKRPSKRITKRVVTAGFFGGNNKLLDANGEDIYSPNITFDPETGIGRWSEAEFVRAVRTGVRPDRSMLRPPMAPFAEMTEEEAAAVFVYLKTVPVLRNPRRVSPAMRRAAAR